MSRREPGSHTICVHRDDNSKRINVYSLSSYLTDIGHSTCTRMTLPSDPPTITMSSRSACCPVRESGRTWITAMANKCDVAKKVMRLKLQLTDEAESATVETNRIIIIYTWAVHKRDWCKTLTFSINFTLFHHLYVTTLVFFITRAQIASFPSLACARRYGRRTVGLFAAPRRRGQAGF